MNRKLFLLLALLACFVLPLGHLAAQEDVPAPAAPNYPWGDPFPIGPAADFKYRPAAAMDAAGNMVVGWTQDLPYPVDDNHSEIYAQRLDATGAPRGMPFRLNGNTDRDEILGGLSMDASGNLVAVWVTYPLNASSGVYGRCFAPDGTPRGDDFPLDIAGHVPNVHAPDVAMADDGRFVVVWSARNQDGIYNQQIYARLFSATCQPLGAPLLVNNVDTDEDVDPAVGIDATGNFIVAWQSWDSDLSGVFARRFNREGLPQGGQFRVNQRQRSTQTDVDVAMDAAGTATLVWTTRAAGNHDIMVRRYNRNGVALGSEFRPHTLSTKTEYIPQVVTKPSGEFVVMWAVERYEDNRDLWVRLYNKQGKPIGAARPMANGPDDEYSGALATGGENRFLAIWHTQWLYNTQCQFMGRLFGPGVGPQTTTFTPTNDAYVSSFDPNTVFNEQQLKVRNGAMEDFNPYLKFNVAGLNGTVQSAKLRLWVVDTGYDGGRVFAVSPFYRDTTTLWLETALTWNNAPAIDTSSTSLGHLGINPPLNQWVEVDVTPVVVAALADNGRVSLAIWNGAANVVAYGSKESAHPPQLVIVTN